MHKMRLTFFILSVIFILFGCGSDETSAPIEREPNYFPDAVGSRWVYRNTDGLQWTREVSGDTNIEGKDYQIFRDIPPIEVSEFDFLLSMYYRHTSNQVLALIGEKVERLVQTELPKAVQPEFAGLELTAVVNPISYPEFVLLQTPLTPNLQWDAYNVKVDGNIILQNLSLLQIPFEMRISVKAEVVSESSIDVPAGNFENAYGIEYETEIMHSVLSKDETTQHQLTVWFVPHVGIVKFEGEDGTTELIEYNLVTIIEE